MEMNKVNWTAVGVFGVVVLLALVVGLGFLGGGRGYGGWGMMGPGMMGGYGGWGYSPLNWVGMAFMWLIPIALIVLTVLGVVYLVRAVGSGSGNPSSVARTCPSCGRAVQLDWRNCPHCGASLAEA
ncbi:MAG: hypothetical protein A2Z37_08030 [Chloroflexi bacterium RBG_19FT_COMBO_62_14]|nr:MAG: hypothetical protein A2Z37_08030 [Chloroflexi bacterium RBG_19FT_COMBO_62_14]